MWWENYQVMHRYTEGAFLEYERKLANTFPVLGNSRNSVNIPPSEKTGMEGFIVNMLALLQ